VLSHLRPTAPLPFRNGFRSFLTALQFGLTLGGGGTDSADCEFEIQQVLTEEDDDESVMIHNVTGMDVMFSIRTFHHKEVRELPDGTTYAELTDVDIRVGETYRTAL